MKNNLTRQIVYSAQGPKYPKAGAACTDTIALDCCRLIDCE